LKIRFAQCTLALASLLAGGAVAADTLRPVVSAGLTYGGDDWQVARGASGSPLLIHGGGRFKVGAGALWDAGSYPLQVSLMANYHYDPRAGANGRAKFSRAPLEAMAYYTGLESLRVGVGLSYVAAPTVKATVDGADQTIKFKNATGRAFELGYALTPALWGNLRLSTETYKPKAAGAAHKADVTNLSLNLSYQF
jgi:hypothetical protein